jgi:5-methyltetrahydropteroyltriglutamate--homocysteine methyltransferase
MTLPTEPIGSIPRPQALIDGMQAAAAGTITPEDLDALYDDAVRDTLRRFEATGSRETPPLPRSSHGSSGPR